MTLKPFSSAFVATCPACGTTEEFRRYPKRYCVAECEPDGSGGFVDVGSAAERAQPHTHVSGPTCGFTWLMAIADSGECARLTSGPVQEPANA